MALNLHPHNQRILAEMTDILARYGRCAIEMATGCGKSFVVYGYHALHPNDRTLIITPHAYIASDQMRKIKAEDPTYDFSRISAMTYAKLNVLANTGALPKNLDCIVLDELHHTSAPKWGDAVRQLIGLNPDARVIGTTATPVRNDGRNPMDALFGDAHTTPYTLIQAWVDDVLPRPTYVVGAYDLTSRFVKIGQEIMSVQDAENRGYLEKLYAKLKSKIASGADNVDTLVYNHITSVTNHPKVIVFCPNIDQMHKTAQRIPDWFRTDPRDMHIYSVSARQTPDQNDRTLRQFSDDKADCTRVLLSVNCVGEGVHVSGIDAVIMCRQTNSTQVYIQQMGRCLESHSKKQPVVLDLVDNLHEVGKPEFIRQYVKRTVSELIRSGEYETRIKLAIVQGQTPDEAAQDVVDQVVNAVGPNPTLATIINAAAGVPGSSATPLHPVQSAPSMNQTLKQFPKPTGTYQQPHKTVPVPLFNVIDTTVSTRELIDCIEDALEKNRLAEDAIMRLTTDACELFATQNAPASLKTWLDQQLEAMPIPPQQKTA